VSPRRRERPRCTGCGLKPDTCLCPTFPRLRFATPIAVVHHAREQFKPTNTGRLFVRMVETATLLPFGVEGKDFDDAPLRDPAVDWRVLYPREDAVPIDRAPRPAEGRRLGFVVLDGSWTQAARMSRRVPVVRSLPCVSLPEGAPSIWTVRTQLREDGRSTFEAAEQALRAVEGPEATAPLRDAFARVTAAMLHLKGKRPTPEAPEAWRC
jgi:DTW domain-containing protein YfiP